MLSTNITRLRKDIFSMIENIVLHNDPLKVDTKYGSAVILSEDDYNSLMETLYLTSMPDVSDSIEEGLDTSITDCIPESEVTW